VIIAKGLYYLSPPDLLLWIRCSYYSTSVELWDICCKYSQEIRCESVNDVQRDLLWRGRLV